jgi:hypothetical protein
MPFFSIAAILSGCRGDAPASDAVVALDAPGARRDDPPSVMGVDERRPESERKPSLRGVPRRRARIGRPTRLTPRLAKALVKIIAQTGRIEPAARRCGMPVHPHGLRHGWALAQVQSGTSLNAIQQLSRTSVVAPYCAGGVADADGTSSGERGLGWVRAHSGDADQAARLARGAGLGRSVDCLFGGGRTNNAGVA